MRYPVYRNLDKPFQILGFNTLELTILCFCLVGGGEVADALGASRIWPLIFTIILGLSIHWIRHSLGDFFLRRLIRFLQLPGQLQRKIVFRAFNKAS